MFSLLRHAAEDRDMAGIGGAALCSKLRPNGGRCLDFVQTDATLQTMGHLLGDLIRREEAGLHPF